MDGVFYIKEKCSGNKKCNKKKVQWFDLIRIFMLISHVNLDNVNFILFQPVVGATFFGLNTLSCAMGTLSVLLARRVWNWGRVVRERRRIINLTVRLDAQLSQVVVEETIRVPLAEVLPDTGKPPKGRGRIRKATPPKKIWSPKRANLNRRLSAVWADEEVVVRVRPGVRTRSQTSLASTSDSFQFLF